MVHLSLLVLVLASLAHLSTAQFNFNIITSTAPFEVRVDSYIAPTVAPVAYTDAQDSIGVASAGAYILYGTQTDVWLTLDDSATWSLLAGLNGNGLPPGDNVSVITGSGNAGCQHRTNFNRFYWMGNSNQNSAAVASTGTFVVYMSVDGQEWTNIIDAQSNINMTARPANLFGFCVVDLQNRVYSVLGNDTWVSNNLGVTWSPVVASSYFTIRQDQSGAIFQMPGSSVEYIIAIAGRGWISPTNTYGSDYNDVWVTSNYGASWQLQNGSPGFWPRENPNVAVATNGVIVMNGGNFNGGYGGGSPGQPNYLQGWASDTWCSFNIGQTWQQLAASTISKYAQAASYIDSNGYWFILAGQTGPANNTGYTWNNEILKSTQSFLQISSWASSVNVVVPSSFTNAQVAVPSTLCSYNTFQFNLITNNYPFEARVDSFVATVMAPLGFTDSSNNIGVAPVGSYVLFGTQPDVWVSSSDAATWSLLAGWSGNGLPPLDVNTIQTGSGNAGCQHRANFNRFYWMGISNQNSGAVQATSNFFNYMSVDGQEWFNIINPLDSVLMANRSANRFGFCVVDNSARVYSVGGADTWVSNNLGVTWSPVVASSYFTIRQDQSGTIFQMPGSSVEYIIAIAGRGWISPTNTYGSDYNDVWVTSNYGASWQLQNGSPGFWPRENPNVAVATNGVIVMNGGNFNGGYGGGSPGQPNYLQGWASDTWCSFNIGQTWQQLAASTNAKMAQAGIVVDPSGYVIILAGQTGPAANVGYSWTNTGYKSTLSLNTIATWGPSLNIVIPPTFTNAIATPANPLCSASSGTTTSGGSGSVIAGSSTGSNGGGGGSNSASSCSSSGSSLSNGAIAGLVIGVSVGVGLLVCVIIMFCFSTSMSFLKGDKKSSEQRQTPSKYGEMEESSGQAVGDTGVEMN